MDFNCRLQIANRKCLALVVLLILAPPLAAGTIRMLDGKTFEGEVRLDNGQILVTPKRGQPARLELADVLEADFRNTDLLGEVPVHMVVEPAWHAQDVGPTGTPGSMRFVNGRYAIKGAGANISSAADSFYFIYQELRGDGQIRARLSDLQAVNPYEKAGVMIRAEFNERDSKTAFVFLTPRDGSSFAWRDAKGGEMKASPLAGERPPAWLRLTRVRNTITAYKAADGGTWQQVGEALEIAMEQRVYIGLAVCSRDVNTACAATFDGVLLQIGTPRGDASPAPRLAAGGGIESPRGNAAALLNRAVILRSGSLIGNVQIQSASDKSIQIIRGDGKPQTLSTNDVARLILAPITPLQLAKIPPHGSGVLLAKGDFMEGEFESLANGRVKTSSVLFGPSSFAAGTEAVVIVLHETGAAQSAWAVKTSEGFIYMARSARVEKDQLVVEDDAAGTVKIAMYNLAEIKVGGGRFDWLNEMRPARIDAASGVSTAMAYTPITSGAMVLGGQSCERGLVCRAGTSLTYALDGRHKIFLCRVGVPDGVVPMVAVRIAVLADGKELYRSPLRTSLDDAAALSLNVAGAKTLTLRVESAGDVGLPASVLWGDPALVK